MPITSPEGYLPGHFDRVFKHLIDPACVKAGFTAIRADTVNRTNYIILDILKRIISSDLVLCDLSGRNPNVLYELGIRQAFNKPVVLIKDQQTDRIFDIQGLRTYDYDASLRVDTVLSDERRLVPILKETAEPSSSDVNSLIELLGVQQASLPAPIEITERDSIVLNALRDLADRVDYISQTIGPTSRRTAFAHLHEYISSGREFEVIGEEFYDGKANSIGKLKRVDRFGKRVVFDQGGKDFAINMSDPLYKAIDEIPF